MSHTHQAHDKSNFFFPGQFRRCTKVVATKRTAPYVTQQPRLTLTVRTPRWEGPLPLRRGVYSISPLFNPHTAPLEQL